MSSMAGDQQHHHVFALFRRINELALEKQLWPGFDPGAIPLAVYDGALTFLFGSKKAPAGFHPINGIEFDCMVFDGRHPSIVANTCAMIEDVLTATLMTDQENLGRDRDLWASVAIHEMFHVFQFQNQDKWVHANEADRFMYPLSDAGLLRLRRAEVAALRRAVETQEFSEKIGWASCALQIRQERFAQMAPPFSQYERRTEIIEGLASHVEAKSVGRHSVDLPEDGYRPDELRRSCYRIGHAYALLLDETSPDWKLRFEAQAAPSLDELLSEALASYREHFVSKEFSPADWEHFRDLAEQDVIGLENERTERVRDFKNKPGQRIVVEADDAAPFQLGMFDPSNVFLLGVGVLHTRLMELGRGEHTIRMLREDTDVVALTESAGPHPLFSGIRRVEIVVDGEVNYTQSSGVVTISARGLDVRLSGELHLENGTIIVRLAGDVETPAS